MKIKKDRKFSFVLSILVILGCIGLIIYQLFNSDFDALNLIILLLGMDGLENSLEKK